MAQLKTRISNSSTLTMLRLFLLLMLSLYIPTAFSATNFEAGKYNFKESEGRITLAIVNDGANNLPLKMHFRITGTGNNPATYKVDFKPIDGDDNILIPPGGTSASVSFDIVDDTDDEEDETFRVELWSGYIGEEGSDILASTSVVIFDNDTASPGSIRALKDVVTVNEGQDARVGFERVSGSDGKLQVDFGTEPGSAKKGSDFTNNTGTLNWADNEAGTKYVTVKTKTDTDDEKDEDFHVYLATNDNNGPIGTRVIIKNVSVKPGLISLSRYDYTVREDAGKISVNVRRTDGSNGKISVDYRTTELSDNKGNKATTNKDFKETKGTVSWNDGDTSDKSISIEIYKDELDEGTERFALNFSNPTGGADINFDNQVSFSIEDVPPENGRIRIKTKDISVNENSGQASIAVERLDGVSGKVSVKYSTGASGDTAEKDKDYKNSSGTLNWDSGDSSDKTIKVPLIKDSTKEGNEIFTVLLSGVSGGATLDSQKNANVTIQDSTSFGNISFSSDQADAREDVGSIAIKVTRSNGSDGVASVRVQSGASTDTAIAGNDYTTLDEVIEWANGESGEKSVSLKILDDDVIDEAESLSLTLSEVSGAELSSPTSMTVEIENTTLPKFGGIGFATQSSNILEGSGARQFSVQREGGSDGVVTVQYNIGNASDSAEEGSDYSTPQRSGELRWEDNDSTAKTIDISILGDAVSEENETLTISLSNPTGGATLSANPVHTITIEDTLPVDFTPVLGIVSGDQQSGFPGTILQPFVLSVSNGDTPAPDIIVSWSVDPPDAGRLIDGDSNRSDGDSIAKNTLEILKGGVISVTATINSVEDKRQQQKKISSRAASDRAVFTVNAGFEGSASLTDNQRKVGKSLDSACPALEASDNLTAQQQDLLETCNTLKTANAADLQSGVARLTPEELFAIGTSSLDTSDIQVTNVQSRINAIRLGASGLDLASLQIDLYGEQIPGYVSNAVAQQLIGGGGSAGDDGNGRLGVFVNGSIAFGSLDETDVEMGLDFDTQGLTLGMDYRTEENWVFGGAIGLTSHEGKFSSEGGELELSGTSLSGFATWYDGDNAYFDAILSYGQNEFTVKRRINLDGQADQFATSKPDSSELSLSIGAGLEYRSDSWQFGPYGRLGFTQASVSSYEESASDPTAAGSGSVLTVEDQSLKSSVLVVGGQLSNTISTSSGVWIPQLRLEFEHRLDDSNRKIEAAFVHDPSSTSFEIASENIDTDYLNFGTGVSAVFQNGKSGYLFYETRLGQDRLTQHWIKAGLRLEF